MAELLTTDEAATYLRLSERKLYELVAQGAVPCTKVTGRWLFPRAALDRWVTAGLIAPAALAQVAAPPIVGGSHDPLLEWALRESGCGLASLPEGSEEGLRRLTRGEVMVAAIHLHALDGDDEAGQYRSGCRRTGVARRRRDCVCAARAGHPGRAGKSARARATSPRSPRSGARMAQRPPAPARNCCCSRCWRAPALRPTILHLVKPVCPTGPDIAQAVRSGRADCGIATRVGRASPRSNSCR